MAACTADLCCLLLCLFPRLRMASCSCPSQRGAVCSLVALYGPLCTSPSLPDLTQCLSCCCSQHHTSACSDGEVCWLGLRANLSCTGLAGDSGARFGIQAMNMHAPMDFKLRVLGVQQKQRITFPQILSFSESLGMSKRKTIAFNFLLK